MCMHYYYISLETTFIRYAQYQRSQLEEKRHFPIFFLENVTQWMIYHPKRLNLDEPKIVNQLYISHTFLKFGKKYVNLRSIEQQYDGNKNCQLIDSID